MQHLKIAISTALVTLMLGSLVIQAAPPAGHEWEPIPELTDEFEGETLDVSKWHDHNPGWKGREPAFFSKDNVEVRDGELHLTARAEDLPDLPEGYHTFTTAAVKSTTRVKYGYFEIRAQAMDSKASSAFWFYTNELDENGKSHWWTEIDVFEICGRGEKERTYFMTAHVFSTPEDGEGHWQTGEKWIAPERLADNYHTYALEWDEEIVRWYVDGVVRREIENTHWHQPLHMNFDSETFERWFGLPNKENLPSTFSIQYVRSWKKKASETSKIIE